VPSRGEVSRQPRHSPTARRRRFRRVPAIDTSGGDEGRRRTAASRSNSTSDRSRRVIGLRVIWAASSGFLWHLHNLEKHSHVDPARCNRRHHYLLIGYSRPPSCPAS
jgi:hypothetical protein